MVFNLKRGFTLIELLIVVAIIGILLAIIFGSLNSSRRKARISAALESARSAIPIIISCNDSRGTVSAPNASGGNQICDITHTGSNWAPLQNGYLYQAGGFYTENCNFNVASTQDEVTINCRCSTSTCLVEE